jgi:hypothetical protein
MCTNRKRFCSEIIPGSQSKAYFPVMRAGGSGVALPLVAYVLPLSRVLLIVVHT